MGAEERLVFGHTMEALLSRCGRDLTPTQWSELKSRWRVDLDKIQPAYPFTLWCEVLTYLAAVVHPGLSPKEGEEALGREFIERYTETLIGKALFAMLRLLSTERVVRRLARSFRTGTSFTEVEVRELNATGCTVVFNVVEPGGRVTQGVLARGLTLAGIRELSVTLEALEGESATYRLTWSK